MSVQRVCSLSAIGTFTLQLPPQRLKVVVLQHFQTSPGLGMKRACVGLKTKWCHIQRVLWGCPCVYMGREVYKMLPDVGG